MNKMKFGKVKNTIEESRVLYNQNVVKEEQNHYMTAGINKKDNWVSIGAFPTALSISVLGLIIEKAYEIYNTQTLFIISAVAAGVVGVVSAFSYGKREKKKQDLLNLAKQYEQFFNQENKKLQEEIKDKTENIKEEEVKELAKKVEKKQKYIQVIKKLEDIKATEFNIPFFNTIKAR